MLGWSNRLRRVGVVAALALAMVGTAGPVLGTAPASQAAAGAAYRSAPDTYENRIVYWTNVARKRHGLQPVRKRACTDRYAESWVRHLAATGSFYHQDVTAMYACPGVYAVGENLARGAMSPRRTVRAWLRSPGHRRNLLKPRYTHIGVGSVYSAVDGGRLYTAQTFTGR